MDDSGLQWDGAPRAREMTVHLLGQIPLNGRVGVYDRAPIGADASKRTRRPVLVLYITEPLAVTCCGALRRAMQH